MLTVFTAGVEQPEPEELAGDLHRDPRHPLRPGADRDVGGRPHAPRHGAQGEEGAAEAGRCRLAPPHAAQVQRVVGLR